MDEILSAPSENTLAFRSELTALLFVASVLSRADLIEKIKSVLPSDGPHEGLVRAQLEALESKWSGPAAGNGHVHGIDMGLRHMLAAKLHVFGLSSVSDMKDSNEDNPEAEAEELQVLTLTLTLMQRQRQRSSRPTLVEAAP